MSVVSLSCSALRDFVPGDGGGNDGVSRPESVKVDDDSSGDDGDGSDDGSDDGGNGCVCACCDNGGDNDSVDGGDDCCVGDCVSGVFDCGDEWFCCGECVSFSADDCTDIGTELSIRIGDCGGCF